MKEKKKRIVFLSGLGLFIFLIAFLVTAILLEDRAVLSLLRNSEEMMVKSFHVLGLDGKEKNPRREREKKYLENTTADTEVLKVNEEAVYYPEFAFYLLASQKAFEEAFGKKVWSIRDRGKNLQELLIEDIAEEIIQLKIVVSEAEKTGLVLSEKEKEEIVSTVTEQLSFIDPVLAAKYYLDAELLTKIYEENFLADKFYAAYLKEKAGEGVTEEGSLLFKRAYGEWKRRAHTEVFFEKLHELIGKGS